MNNLIKRIKSKYILQILFDYVPLIKGINLIKYNRKLKSDLDLDYNKIRSYFFLQKIIKPIANCEDYIPIIEKFIKFPNNKLDMFNKNEDAIDLFCNYFNRNTPFIPQINKIKNNEKLLSSLYYFKIGFSSHFINNFYNNENIFEFKNLFDFCNKYGKKIKEITFMDNNIANLSNKKESYFIFKYIIKHSNVQKIEDRYFDGEKSVFLKLLDLEYNGDIYDKIYLKDDYYCKNQRNIMDIIKEIKYYSLYFFHNYNVNQILKPFIDIICFNSKNLEELKLTKINDENSSSFINLLKDLNNLKSLTIESIPDNHSFFDDISKVIKENTLKKLEMNLFYFEDGINIINRNIYSLNELTLKINHKKNNNLPILKTVYNLVNLRKLKIITKFQIFNEKDNKYLSFKYLEYLEISLYIKKGFIDFNSFFENIPNIKTIIFYGIQFDNMIEKEEIKNPFFNEFKNNSKFILFLRKIKFYNCKKNSSFFIFKFLQFLSKIKNKDNITEIKIENCEFDKNIGINDIFNEILKFSELRNLHINNTYFEKGQNFFYDKMNNFKKLEKFYFKGLNNEQNNIHLLSFISHLSEQCKNLINIGLSCKNLNSDDINLILKKLKDFQFLAKVNLFDNYTKVDFYSDRDKTYNGLIDLEKIKDYYMVDLRNINITKNYISIKINSNFYPKIAIKDYFHENKNQLFSNKNEDYYSYQNLFSENSKIKIMYYSKKFFIINEIL